MSAGEVGAHAARERAILFGTTVQTWVRIKPLRYAALVRFIQ
jgi:hypothetical protein